MTSFDDIALPDSALGADQTTNQGKLNDIYVKGRDVWWRICSRTGLSKLIAAFADGLLDRGLVKDGPDWLPTKVPTSARQEIQALPQNFANTVAAADAATSAAEAAKTSADAATAAVEQLRTDLAQLVDQAITAALANVQVTANVDQQALAAAVANEFERRLAG